MSTATTTTRVVIAGGIPDHTDVVLSGIFIALFFISGVYFHFRIFHAYGKKFIWSALCFSFSMARVAALSLRIAVAQNPTDKNLNLVAQILITAGVAILFVVNLQLSRRFFGQLHPHHAISVKRFVTGSIISVVPVLVMVITTVVQSFTTTDAHTLSIDRTVRLVGSVIFVFIPFIPIPIVLMVLILKALSPGGLSQPTPLAEGDADPEAGKPNITVTAAEKRSTEGSVTDVNDETAANSTTSLGKPGMLVADRPRVKGEPESGFGAAPVTRGEILKTAAIIIIPAILMTFEQAFRTAQGFYVADGNEAPWYMSKAAFWVCVFGMEILVSLTFGLAVLPRRFSHLRIV